MSFAVATGKQRALQVKKQPDDTFFKDEGGKGNVLTTTITVSQSVLKAMGALQLKCELHYESNRRVEEPDQSILNISSHEFEPPMLTLAKPEVELEFRLEKVSRRKDNQRFRLHVEVDYEAMGVDPKATQYVAGVSTAPITVLSKRKTGERQVSKRVPRPECGSTAHAQEAAAAAKDTLKAVGALNTRVGQLERTVRASNELVRKQADVISRLESVLEGLLGGAGGAPPGAPAGPGALLRHTSLALSDTGGSEQERLTAGDVESALSTVQTPRGGSSGGSHSGASLATGGVAGGGGGAAGGGGNGAGAGAGGGAAAPSAAFVHPSPRRGDSIGLLGGLRGLSATLGAIDGPPSVLRDWSAASAHLEAAARDLGFPALMRREDSAALIATLLGGAPPPGGRFTSVGPPGDDDDAPPAASKRLRSRDVKWDFGEPAPEAEDAAASVPAKRTRRASRG